MKDCLYWVIGSGKIEAGSDMTGQREEGIRQDKTGLNLFYSGKLRGKVVVVWFLHLSDLSVLSPVSDSGLSLLRPIGNHATL